MKIGEIAKVGFTLMRKELYAQVDRVPDAELLGARVALSWLESRARHEPDRIKLEEDGLLDAWREFEPSIDDLLWLPPKWDEVAGVVDQMWADGRRRWDEQVAEDSAIIADLNADDIEDHAMAASSGEDPTGIKRGPRVNRPSPEPEPDDWA